MSAPLAFAIVDGVAAILGATDGGLTNNEISNLLAAARIRDPVAIQQDATPPGAWIRASKRERIRRALLEHQDLRGTGDALAGFIHQAMAPARYISDPDTFRARRDGLNEVLIAAGLTLTEQGRLARQGAPARTLDEIAERAGALHSKLRSLDCHPDAIRYCNVELLRRSNVHAAQEAVKGLFDRLRRVTTSALDGGALVDFAFGFRNQVPALALSLLRTPSEQSEQTGLMSILKGLYGLYRNPLAHEVRLVRDSERPVEDNELLHLLISVSLIHRHLDRCSGTRQ